MVPRERYQMEVSADLSLQPNLGLIYGIQDFVKADEFFYTEQ